MWFILYIILFSLFILFNIFNYIVINKLSESNKLRIWWEENICSSKDLEPFD